MAQIVNVKDIKVDAEGFRQTMKIFAAAMGRMGGAVVKQQAAMLAEDLLNYTLPVEGTGGGRKGTSTAARDIGMGTLDRDVRSIFKPLYAASYEDIASQDSFGVFAAWVSDRERHGKGSKSLKWVNTDNWVGFQNKYSKIGKSNGDFSGVNQGEGFIRSTHVAVRGGTTVQNYGWKVKANKKQYFIDNHAQKVGGYLKEAEKRVGRLKSGWAEASRALGRNPKSAAWIDRNQQGNGYAVDDSQNALVPSATVANRIHFLMGRGAGTTLWHSAFNHRASAMREVMYRRINKIASGDAKRLEQIIRELNIPESQYQIS